MSRSARSSMSMSSLNSATKSAMKSVDRTLKPVDRALNGNKVVSNSIIVVLVVYAVLVAPNLPMSVARAFDNMLFRVVFILVIALVCLVDPVKALLLAICFVVSVQRLHNLKKSSVPANNNLGDNISNVINTIQNQAQNLIQQGQQMIQNGNVDGQDLVKQGNHLLNQVIEAQQEAEEEASSQGVNLNVAAANNAVQQQAAVQRALQANNVPVEQQQQSHQQVVQQQALQQQQQVAQQQQALQQQAQNPVHKNVVVETIQGNQAQVNIGELLNQGASEDPTGAKNFAEVQQAPSVVQQQQAAQQQAAQQQQLTPQQQQVIAQQVNSLAAQAQALNEQALQEESNEVSNQLNSQAQQLNNQAQQLAATYFTTQENLESAQSRNAGCATTPLEVQSQKLQLGPQSLLSHVQGAPNGDQFAQF